MEANREKTTVKKKTYFLKNYVVSLFTTFLPLIFYLFEVQSTVLVYSSLQGEHGLIW